MGRDTPLSADQDVLVDANIFYAIGHRIHSTTDSEPQSNTPAASANSQDV